MERTNLTQLINKPKQDKAKYIGSFVADNGKVFRYTYKTKRAVYLQFVAYCRRQYSR